MAPILGVNSVNGDAELSTDGVAWTAIGEDLVTLTPSGGDDETAELQTVVGRHPILGASHKHAAHTIELVIVWGDQTAPGPAYAMLRTAREGNNLIWLRWAPHGFAAAGNAMYITADRTETAGPAVITNLVEANITSAADTLTSTCTLMCEYIDEDVTPAPA